MKRRVLQLIGSFHQGGSERQAVALTRMLKQEGTFEVYVATLNKDGVLRSEIDALGLPPVAEFPLTSFFNANFVHQMRAGSRYLTANKIDVVHSHDFYTNVFGMAAASLAGTKVRIASKRETSAMRTGPQEFVERLAFGRAHAIAANAEAVRQHLASQWQVPGKIEVIYNGIDVDRFEGAAPAENLAINPRARVITLVANLRHPVKNVPMFLNAAKLLIEKLKDVEFVIAGEGELEPELKRTSSGLGLEGRVHFIGRCSDVPGLLARSYACVLTSQAEGFSNSILEYMAAGKPVVATRVGGAAEAITEGTGFLIEPNDHQALATRLIELLSDEELAARMGRVGRERVKLEFSSQRQLRNTIQLYNRLSTGEKHCKTLPF